MKRVRLFGDPGTSRERSQTQFDDLQNSSGDFKPLKKEEISKSVGFENLVRTMLKKNKR